MRRHFIIPDTQLEPGVPMEHIDWAAQAILDYKPDVVVHLGDNWTMKSLSSYDRPGSRQMEGARYLDDIAVGNEAMTRLMLPVRREMERLRRNRQRIWLKEDHFLLGNHEDRISRAVAAEPKYEGVLGLHMLDMEGMTTHPFLEIVEIDGVLYSHYFSQTHSPYPIGGNIDNRLNKIGQTFVQGHQQGFQYGTRQYPGKRRRHGLVCGSFYQHGEHYRNRQCQDEWRGVVVLNEVEDGDFCIMPLTLDYLRRKYG